MTRKAPLEKYRSMRDFASTREPAGEVGRSDPAALSYVIQKHAASRLHWDFRLELDGVLVSWAVPKGPSLDPADKRLAVKVEDHPLDYGGFEGTIPKGEYGGGSVMLWDRGTWVPDGDPHAALAKGDLSFTLTGERLAGAWKLVKTRADAQSWLLLKRRDEHARPGYGTWAVETHVTSVESARSMDEIGSGGDDWPIAPQLATPAPAPPPGEGWVHELKLDGYRLLLRWKDGAVRVATRAGHDWTDRLGPIVAAAEALGPDDAVIDGELVAFDPEGRTSFGKLQRALGAGATGLALVAFDLLRRDGVDLRDRPLSERIAALAEIVPEKGPIRRSRVLRHAGADVLARACALGAEGIVSKRLDAPYVSGRSAAWVKVKCLGRDDFRVVGFVRKPGSALSALILAEETGGRLVHVGRVGTGFREVDRRRLREALDPLAREVPALPDPPRAGRSEAVTWVAPERSVEVAFGARTEAGILRHASFRGLREDTAPARPLEEPPAPASFRLTNPSRVVFPEIPLTKRELAEYVLRVSALLLPAVADRPLSLLRCPDGRAGTCFFQKHPKHFPDAVLPVAIPGDDAPHAQIRDVEGLLALVQMGVVELHPWGARSDRPDRPDRVIFDLDPDETLELAEVVDAAHEVRALLDELGLASFVRTTGGKGLHVVVPLARRHAWDEVKAFAHEVAQALVVASPKRYVAQAGKAKRAGRIYVDWLRNGFGATAVASWSPRARPGAPVAVPLRWSEVRSDLDPAAFAVPTIAAPTADPWEGFAAVKQSLTGAVRSALTARRRSGRVPP